MQYLSGFVSVDEYSRQHRELLDIFEREMQKTYLLRSVTTTNTIEVKINNIGQRCDERATQNIDSYFHKSYIFISFLRIDEVNNALREEQLADVMDTMIMTSQDSSRPTLQRRLTRRQTVALLCTFLLDFVTLNVFCCADFGAQ